MKKILLSSLVALVYVCPMLALNHYFCDFEDASSRNRWVLNPATNENIYNQLANKWYIGEPGNHSVDGQHGLFISDDEGQSAHYTANNCWVFAYDTISLSHQIYGDYIFIFDYLATGSTIDDDGLYVFWIPIVDPETGDSIQIRSIPYSSGLIPTAYNDYVLHLQPNANRINLSGFNRWSQCMALIPNNQCDGTPHYLVFAWSNGSMPAQQPGVMVDNIEIAPYFCNAPISITASLQDSLVRVSWQGDIDSEYEVSAYAYETGTWSGPKIVRGTQTSFADLPEGQLDLIVRAQCGDGSYSPKGIYQYFNYYPDWMCIDYINLNNAVCYVNHTEPKNTYTFNDFEQVTPINYGPSQVSSCHTVHTDRNETEPYTNNEAKTIPDDEIASVRLGSWGAEKVAYRIEFPLLVDSAETKALLIKYLPILTTPGHDAHENPRFTVDVLMNGQSIGGFAQMNICVDSVLTSGAIKELRPDAQAQGWHFIKINTSSYDHIWKEWSTVAVPLDQPEFYGRQLTVRLTSSSCIYGGAHYGYAYFTLGCVDASLNNMPCGQINPVFEAPEGFGYRWMYAGSEQYRLPDGSVPEQYILSRERVYEVGMQDDSIYVVDCISLLDSTRYVSYNLTSMAYSPVAQMSEPIIEQEEASAPFVVHLDASSSYVQLLDHVKSTTLPSPMHHIDRYQWYVDGLNNGYSDKVAPTFEFPASGGDFQITLRTTCGTCESTVRYNLHLEPNTEKLTDAESDIMTPHKLLRDGQILILRGDKTYTLTGHEVK